MDIYLNVIFHGPFIFVIYPGDKIEALSPDLEGHDFGAGTWQKEIPCSRNTYILDGITEPQTPMQGPDVSNHVIIDATNVSNVQIPKVADYRFILPLPFWMKPLGLLIPKAPISFTGSDAGKINVPAQIGSAHMFSYRLAPTDVPKLTPLSWSPELKKINSQSSAVNLHIFSESPFYLGDNHPYDDFGPMVQMLPGLSLQLGKNFPDIEFELDLNVRGFGIDDEEQGGLRGVPKVVNSSPIGNPQSGRTAALSPLIPPLVPPRICDSPSLVITNAS